MGVAAAVEAARAARVAVPAIVPPEEAGSKAQVVTAAAAAVARTATATPKTEASSDMLPPRSPNQRAGTRPKANSDDAGRPRGLIPLPCRGDEDDICSEDRDPEDGDEGDDGEKKKKKKKKKKNWAVP
eukprot:NODE_29233_length_452_cov_1.575385.p1 GENE.NODE_29233_length_452_cov_1.575385~~NODE_29233_length_452_cov_1.575385.p1  ORF type:complete len:128 (+),score=45.68 NODE_29233_length_452_cov_1.575385:3-386(+)